ncbi:sugar O-acetyltransferase [Pararhodonellum marinum]|uniref:sugar O-acetyltransferase n=1 Tax=Pararhodonellum marinum TaxID=2755358 RepID=UPI00188DD39E|nr:sugar O-acetyltransferase [Pararhodonellum marinum]
MKSEKEKMLAGELYLASDPLLMAERLKARELLHRFNHSRPAESQLRLNLLSDLLGKIGKNFWIEPPFFCDYGYNISCGDDVFFNFNCVVLDVTPVKIGHRVLIGPNVQFYAATHPMDHKVRGTLLESGKGIIIEDDVWIGGGAILCPGVKIGARSVIGAGAVVTKDIPPDTFAGGIPCATIKKLK